MHLAYRWFSRPGFEREIPDDSKFSKKRHGRFRQSDAFRKVFEFGCRLGEGRTLALGALAGKNSGHDVFPERSVMFAQVRVNGSLVSVAEIASNRPGTLGLLPNTHGCAVAQGVAVNHLAVQASDLSILLQAAVEVVPIETTK